MSKEEQYKQAIEKLKTQPLFKARKGIEKYFKDNVPNCTDEQMQGLWKMIYQYESEIKDELYKKLNKEAIAIRTITSNAFYKLEEEIKLLEKRENL